MDSLMKKALTWVMLGSAVLMFGFTIFDVASGTQSTALWLSLLFWPLIIAICWWILASEKPEKTSSLSSDD